VPGDPSSAAFFVVLGALAPKGMLTQICDVLVNPTRTGFLAAVEQAGVDLKLSASRTASFIEPVCDLEVVGGSPLRAMHIAAAMVPTLIDEIPILAVLAMFAPGQSTFEGLAELRVKESDRLAKTAELITLAGGKAWISGDDLIVSGSSTLQVPSFTYDPAGDHRLAMAAAVLAARAGNEICVLDPECVDVSFPGFFEHLDTLQ
jgi:3-phosphoshikimate 1-carboxyvinyltransferase